MRKGFTLFTPLVGASLLIVAILFSVYMVNMERQRALRIGGLLKREKLQFVAETVRADAFNTFISSLRRGLQIRLLSFSMVFDERELRNHCYENALELITERYFAGKDFVENVALTIANDLRKYSGVTFEEYEIIPVLPSHKEFVEALEKIMSEAKIKPINCTASSCPGGSFYLEFDVSKVPPELAHKLPRMRVCERGSNECTEIYIIPPGKFYVYFPFRLAGMIHDFCRVYDRIREKKRFFYSLTAGSCSRETAACSVFSNGLPIFPTGKFPALSQGAIDEMTNESSHHSLLIDAPCRQIYHFGELPLLCNTESGSRNLLESFLAQELSKYSKGRFVKYVGPVDLEFETKPSFRMCKAFCIDWVDAAGGIAGALIGIMRTAIGLLPGMKEFQSYVNHKYYNISLFCPGCVSTDETVYCSALKRLGFRVILEDSDPTYSSISGKQEVSIVVHLEPNPSPPPIPSASQGSCSGRSATAELKVVYEAKCKNGKIQKYPTPRLKSIEVCVTGFGCAVPSTGLLFQYAMKLKALREECLKRCTGEYADVCKKACERLGFQCRSYCIDENHGRYECSGKLFEIGFCSPSGNALLGALIVNEADLVCLTPP